MAVAPDETEQLLARLEPELAEKQAVIDKRVAREQARLDALTFSSEALEARRVHAEAALEQLEPKRDAMVRRRDEMRLAGSRGAPLRAALWSTAAAALTAGAIIPLASAPEGWLLALLGGEALAVAAGWAAVELWRWRSP